MTAEQENKPKPKEVTPLEIPIFLNNPGMIRRRLELTAMSQAFRIHTDGCEEPLIPVVADLSWKIPDSTQSEIAFSAEVPACVMLRCACDVRETDPKQTENLAGLHAHLSADDESFVISTFNRELRVISPELRVDRSTRKVSIRRPIPRENIDREVERINSQLF